MSKKALLVDSDFFFVEFLSELLTKRGYAVTKAYDGKEAIGKLAEGTVDILFADLVLPKVDGRQLFGFIRDKYKDARFPMVALSGTMIENIGSLHDIGADYFIAKGPADKLTVKLNEFLAEMEIQPFCPPEDKEVLDTGNVFPRRDAVELVKSLRFHQAVIDCAAAGIIIVDDDTRIINANPAALEIIGRHSAEVVNRPIEDLFDNQSRSKLNDGMELVNRPGNLKKVSFLATFNSRIVNTVISPIKSTDNAAGWVIVVDPVGQDERDLQIPGANSQIPPKYE